MRNKTRLWIQRGVCLCTLAAAAAAGAQAARPAGSTVESQLLLCASRTTDSARLACYDGLAETLRSRAPGESNVALEPAPAPAQPSPETPPPRTEVDPETGVPVAVQTPPPRNTETFDTNVQQKQSIRVMIEKVRRNARGDYYFYFDNDEVWKQIDSRTRRIPPLPVAATVSRGLFSSHKLHIDGEVWAMKIRRVK